MIFIMIGRPAGRPGTTPCRDALNPIGALHNGHLIYTGPPDSGFSACGDKAIVVSYLPIADINPFSMKSAHVITSLPAGITSIPADATTPRFIDVNRTKNGPDFETSGCAAAVIPGGIDNYLYSLPLSYRKTIHNYKNQIHVETFKRRR